MCDGLFYMTDLEYLHLAYLEAIKAYQQEEVPIGALIVKDNKIISSAFNTTIKTNNPLKHAEINCLNLAYSKEKTYNLKGYKIYISLEPCLMCLGALINSNIKEIYFSTLNKDEGAFSKYLINPENYNIKIHYLPLKESESILSDFFQKIRTKKL